jgi:hypothetical protein
MLAKVPNIPVGGLHLFEGILKSMDGINDFISGLLRLSISRAHCLFIALPLSYRVHLRDLSIDCRCMYRGFENV